MTMVAVIFEVWPATGRTQRYFDLAAMLVPELQKMDGFLSIERFQSITDPDKLLSLSFWRDEASVAAWRNSHSHRAIQAEGRSGLFLDYRLRVAGIVRDYGLGPRDEAPADSRACHHIGDEEGRQAPKGPPEVYE